MLVSKVLPHQPRILFLSKGRLESASFSIRKRKLINSFRALETCQKKRMSVEFSICYTRAQEITVTMKEKTKMLIWKSIIPLRITVYLSIRLNQYCHKIKVNLSKINLRPN